MARTDSFQKKWASVPSQFERPSDALIERGWAGGAAEDPPEAKWENWWHNRVDEALAEIESSGALAWFVDAPYEAGATVLDAGQIWACAIPNSGIQPSSGANDGHWFVRPAGLSPINGLQAYASPGTFDWEVPAGVKKARVTVIGGGGGGSRLSLVSGQSAGAGGGGGGIASGLVDLTGVSSVTVTVGAGGPGASANNTSGGIGGASSFGVHLTATGGGGGGSVGGAGAGGVGSGGSYNSSLGPGGVGIEFVNVGESGTRRITGQGGGPGGASIFASSASGSLPGNAGVGPGGGGSGGAGVGNGGAGAAGIVIIEW